MFIIKNTVNSKTIKDCITLKPMTFETKELAERFANSMVRTQVACDKKPQKLEVIEGA